MREGEIPEGGVSRGDLQLDVREDDTEVLYVGIRRGQIIIGI